MKITSFDNGKNKISRDINQDFLYNLFQKNMIYKEENIFLNLYVVPREFEMRLDKISNYIYGSPDYVEELMLLNDILSPYSVREGQAIWYCSISDMDNLYVKDQTMNNEINKQNLIKSSQPNRSKQNLSNDQSLPPTVKPSNLEQIKVSKDNKVQIMNTFE